MAAMQTFHHECLKRAREEDEENRGDAIGPADNFRSWSEEESHVREKCKHILPLTTTMPIHYEGVWVCDDCNFEGKSNATTARCGPNFIACGL